MSQDDIEKGSNIGAGGTGQGYTSNLTEEFARQNELRRRGLDSFGQPLSGTGQNSHANPKGARLLVIPLLVVTMMALTSGSSGHAARKWIVGVPMAIAVLLLSWFRFRALWQKSPFVTSLVAVGAGTFLATILTSPRDNINPALALWVAVLAMIISLVASVIFSLGLRIFKSISKK